MSRKRKLWDKTGDVEKLCKRPGRLKSQDYIPEQALTQLFLDNVDIIMNAGEAGS